MRTQCVTIVSWLLQACGVALSARAEPPSNVRVPAPSYAEFLVAAPDLPEAEPLYNPLGAPPRRGYPGRPWPAAAVASTPGLPGADAMADPGSTGVPSDFVAPQPWTWGGAKPGFFQRLTAYETWLAGGGGSALEMHETSALVTGGIPFFSRDTPLLFTPGFTARFLDGPNLPDVPARLYDATLDVRHLRQLTERLGMDVAVTTGAYGDYEHSRAGMVRVSGRGLAAWQWRPTTQLVLGVAYFNRGNLKLLPVGGVIWQPNDDWRIEALVPQPRIARRVIAGADREWWFYLAGEVGGGVWAVDRADGSGDLLSLTDFRLRLGLERFVLAGFKTWLETGYVFGRTLSYRSLDQTIVLSDALLLRAGLAY